MMSGNHYRSFMSAAYAINDSLNWNFGSTSSTARAIIKRVITYLPNAPSNTS